MKANDDGASNSCLPVLATCANLTASTTNFIVEAKERLQAHSQHMAQIHPGKTLSETELSVTAASPKQLTNRQGTNLIGEKKNSCQYSVLISPLVRKRPTKAAWRSPKTDNHRLPLFTTSPRSNFNASSGSVRNQAELPMQSRSSPDVKELSNRISRSSVSQISLSYQDITKEKIARQQSQRKPRAVGFSSLPLARKGKDKTQSPSTTSSSKQFNSKGMCITVCMYSVKVLQKVK